MSFVGPLLPIPAHNLVIFLSLTTLTVSWHTLFIKLWSF